MSRQHTTIAIGASAGGIEALKTVATALPAGLPASVLIVQHVSPDSPGVLPEILARVGRLPSDFATDRAQAEPGRIYVAPPGRHMLLDRDGRLRLTRGPRENRSRPAIDPLFRSVALARGPQAIGVILTGYLNDGTAGLQSIELMGGTCLCQDPREAAAPDMPASALRHVASARRVRLELLGPLLASLVTNPRTEVADIRERTPREVAIEAAIAAGDAAALSGIPSLGDPSTLTCPECHGALFALRGSSRFPRYRCHTGHAFSASALLAGLRESTEETLWGAIRAKQEEAILARHLADHAAATGDEADARNLRSSADRAVADADAIRRVAFEDDAAHTEDL